MTPPDDRRTITATEAQQSLGIKATRVRKWASRGELHPVSIGPDGQRWYLLAEVLDLAALDLVGACHLPSS